jgi:hypothetical protein
MVPRKVRYALRMMANYWISSWPALIVDGKYVTSPPVAAARMGANYPDQAAIALMMNVMDQLVDQQLKTRH